MVRLLCQILCAQKQRNVRCFLQLLDAVVERAPNLIKLQIPCQPQMMADMGVSQTILDQVSKLTQLQALDIPGFHCSLKDFIQIAYLMPNLRYEQSELPLNV
jgi:hypothetical protein